MPNRMRRLFSISYIKSLLGSQQIFRSFCSDYDIVYFGHMSDDDNFRLVKGMTVSTTHVDAHYCIGTAYGRDIMLLQRQDEFRHSPGNRNKEHYYWNILEIDLRSDPQLPHVILDAKHHGPALYKHVLPKFPELSQMPTSYFQDYDPRFDSVFKIFTARYIFDRFQWLVPKDDAAVLAYHFNMFDYELMDDKLYIYYQAKIPQRQKLDQMLQAGMWFAGQLELHVKQVRAQYAWMQQKHPVGNEMPENS